MGMSRVLPSAFTVATVASNSRIATAKDAIRKMIYGFGDVEWALTKFRQIHATLGRGNTIEQLADFRRQLAEIQRADQSAVGANALDL